MECLQPERGWCGCSCRASSEHYGGWKCIWQLCRMRNSCQALLGGVPIPCGRKSPQAFTQTTARRGIIFLLRLVEHRGAGENEGRHKVLHSPKPMGFPFQFLQEQDYSRRQGVQDRGALFSVAEVRQHLAGDSRGNTHGRKEARLELLQAGGAPLARRSAAAWSPSSPLAARWPPSCWPLATPRWWSTLRTTACGATAATAAARTGWRAY